MVSSGKEAMNCRAAFDGLLHLTLHGSRGVEQQHNVGRGFDAFDRFYFGSGAAFEKGCVLQCRYEIRRILVKKGESGGCNAALQLPPGRQY